MSFSSETDSDSDIINRNKSLILSDNADKNKDFTSLPLNSRIKFGIFVSNFGEDKLSEKIELYIKQIIIQSGHEVIIFDPKEKECSITYETIPIYRIYPQSACPGWMRVMNKNIEECDSFIIICMEKFNTVPPILVNFMGLFPKTSYEFKPCGICSYSCNSNGGIIASYHLRHYLNYLGCLVLPNELNISCAKNIFNEKNEIQNDTFPAEFAQFYDKLQWYSKAMKTHRSQYDIPKEPGAK